MFTCAAHECNREHYAKGWCRLHYERLRRYGTLDKPEKPFKGICEIDGCDLEISILKWCKKHYDQQRHAGLDKENVRIADHAHHIKYRYGITIEKYNELLIKQNFLCAICEQPETRIKSGKVKKLAVDHDHKTNKIRELLCTRCNVFLGSINDDIALLQKMIDYIKRHSL